MKEIQYKNAAHEAVYVSFLASSKYRYGSRFLAAVFLLSASRDVWERAQKAIVKKQIRFCLLERRDLGAYGYTLAAAAQDIYENTTHINLYGLSDRYLISEKTFGLITSALRIAREGREALPQESPN